MKSDSSFVAALLATTASFTFAIPAAADSGSYQDSDASADDAQEPMQDAQPTELARADEPVSGAPVIPEENMIVVTAQRREERLQDIPLSVSAITGDELTNAIITTPDRLEQVVPALRVGRSGSDLRPAIRGTYTENVSATGDPRIGIYVDDIYQSRTSQVPPIVDLARVEVQLGPQGTLYGRNSFGGNIAFYSAEPEDFVTASVDALYGRYNHVRLEGHFNTPITEDLAFRIAGLYEHKDGFVENIGSGNDYGGEEQYFARGSLKWRPAALDDRLSVLVRGSYLDLGGEGLGGFGYKILGTLVDPSLIRRPGESLTRNGVTYELPEGFNGNSFTGRGFPIDTRYRDGIADVNGADIGLPVIDDPYIVNYAGDIFRDGSQWQFSGVIDFDADLVRVRSITSYTDFEILRTGSSLTPVLLDFSFQETTAETFTQELQLLSNDDSSPFQWIIGGYYFDDRARDLSVTNQNRSYDAATAPPGFQYSNFGFEYQRSGGLISRVNAYDGFAARQSDTLSLAAYGQASYTIADRLTLTGGLRYTHDTKELTSSRFTFPFAGGPVTYYAHDINDPIDYECGGFIAASEESVGAQDSIEKAYNFVCDEEDFDFFTYRLAADYEVTRDNMVYASYSTGRQAGGFNTTVVVRDDEPGLIPYGTEKVEAWEVGSKNVFADGAFSLNVAAFLNNYTDLQQQTSIPDPVQPLTRVQALIQNSGKDRAYGVEVAAVLRPDPNLTISLAYNYLHARQLDYQVNTFNFGGSAAFCNITPSCDASTGEFNTVQGTPFPNPRTDPNRFVPLLGPDGNQIVQFGSPVFRYVVAGTGRDGTEYEARRAFQPDHVVQIGVAYDIDLGSAGTLTPQVQSYFNSGYILTDLTPDFGDNPAFTKTDLRLTYETESGNIRLQAYVNNLEDEATITRAVYTNHRALLVNYAPPREYGVQVGYRF